MSLRPITIAATLLALAALAAPSRAADLDPALDPALDVPPPVAESKVEFGSGWYIRGDVGAVKLPSLRNVTPSLPANPYAFTPDPPGTQLNAGSKLGYDASLAAGYQFNRWFRTDLMADFQQPLTASSTSGSGNVFCPTGVAYNAKTPAGATDYTQPTYANGGCTGYYRSSVRSYDVLLNAYIDLGTWYSVTPYVGAGAGLSFGHYQASGTYIQANGVPYQVSYTDAQFGATYYQNYDKARSGTYYNFAFAFMAGVGIDVYDHTKLDIGYRYLNLGSIPGMYGTLSHHEVRAGLRYMIDN